jgi:shikimate 5-dehydrogenase
MSGANVDHDSSIEGRLRAMETANALQIAKNVRVDESLEDHEARLRRIEELAPLLKVNQFILMGLGGSVIALIWALLTGQVQLLF